MECADSKIISDNYECWKDRAWWVRIEVSREAFLRR